MKLATFTNNIDSFVEFNDCATNNPVLRKNKIIESLKTQFDKIDIIEIKNEIDLEWLESIHDRDYLRFLKHCYQSFILSPADFSWSDGYHGLIPCNFSKNLPHSSVPIYKLSGFYGSDVMTPIHANTWHNAMVSAQQAYLGASYLHQSVIDANTHLCDLVYILATSPGHHAKRSEYGGYCFINNAIVAAHRLIELGHCKVGILDLDYHAGNGTYEMSQTHPNIVAYSLHCDPIYDYPSFDGFADEYNYVLPPHCNLETYLNCLIKVCEKMVSDNIDVLIIAFGGDTFKDDPDALSIGRFNLDLSSYTEMGKTIREYFKMTPIMITQEGGYNMDHIGDILSLFIRGFGL